MTRSDCTSAYQSVAERGFVERVEAAARAADVPVGDVVDERLERADDVDRQRRLVGLRRVGDELLRPLDQPAVERAQLGVIDCMSGSSCAHDGEKPSMFP